ncbi:MAG: double-strand break repair protein AddB [Phyllobacterium sp.]
MGNTRPRVLSIAPGAAFLPTLVDELLSGRLVPGFSAKADDPAALARATIYVPTRRAARTLRSLLVEMNPARSAILPSIRPLGDFDEDAALFDTASADSLDLAPPIGSVERLLLLAELVQPWRARLPQHVLALFGNEDVAVPATVADAIWLARDLADLMDQVETEGLGWDSLSSVIFEELPNWWQVTHGFLSIVTSLWPQILAERDWSSPAAHRNSLILREAERLRRNPPAGPVIAAGSTGSIPATAELISVIAKLPLGAVILPGLDRDLDDEAWQTLDEPDDHPSIFGHPQYGLKKLIGRIGILRQDIPHPGKISVPGRYREKIVSEALRPAETTEAWAMFAQDDAQQADAVAGIDLIEAASEREEALAVAIALRHAIEDPEKTAALVTADRGLARRVSAELARFNIEADDSGGRPLGDTQPATLFRLMLESIFNPGDPVALLALVKHPMTCLGMARSRVRHFAEVMELVALRGGTGRVTIGNLAAFFDRRVEDNAKLKYEPAWFDVVSPDDIEQARQLCSILSEALNPLTDLLEDAAGAVNVATMVRASVEALENLARDESGSLAAFYSGEPGEKLASVLRNLVSAESDLRFDIAEWPAMVEALIGSETVKPRIGGHPRLFIWGALEARLQTVDTIVIGGLNEGSWPGKTRNDPFMSRPMKSAISLEPPERRIGLAAHDFQMALGMDHVILTRAQKADNAPTVASRWLQRLETVLGKDQTEALRMRGQRYLQWARQIDDAPDEKFIERPQPVPPLEARPKRFSVTEIETLRRDPYAIFAKRILGLKPLEPLIRDPAAAERGSLFHDILDAFTQSGTDPASPMAATELVRIGREFFDAVALPPEIEAVWWPRFMKMVPEFLDWENNRRPVTRHSEIKANAIAVDETGVVLSGRADRIDLMPDGTAEIIDFKTGSNPSKKQAHLLLSPQLSLEAALLARGAFKDVPQTRASELLYVRLKTNGDVKPESILKIQGSEKTAFELGEESWRKLNELLTLYNDPHRGYLSRAMPFKEGDVTGDYDHLARVLEWSAGNGEDDSEGGE